MKASIAVLTLVLLVACGDPNAGTPGAKPTKAAPAGDVKTQPDPDLKVRGYGLVYDGGKKPPELCLGAVNDSLPPQCGGPRVIGWDWDAVPDEQSHGDALWGEYEVTGYYDGKTFEVVDARVPEEFVSEESIYDTPCEEPPGGWKVDDPERATEDDRQAAIRYAESQPDHAATWVDYIDEPTEFTDPKDIILNIAFTEGADIETYEAEIRELWDGPLCVVARAQPSQRELSAIQNSDWEKDYNLEILWSGLDVVEGNVEIGVMFIEDETGRAIDERYGEGIVIVYPALRPVE